MYIKAAYAEASAAFLTCNGKTSNDSRPNQHIWIGLGGQDSQGNQLFRVEVDKVAFKGTAEGFSGLGDDLPFEHSLLTGNGVAAGGIPGDDYVLAFNFNTAAGNCSLDWIFKDSTTTKYLKSTS